MRVILTRRRNRIRRISRKLRPARVPMRAALAARATGPLFEKSLASRTMMSIAIEMVAMKSR